MQFTTIFAAALSVCLVAAAPNKRYLPEMGDGSMDYMCGNKQKAACCDGSNQAGGQAGLLGGILGGIIGGNCALTVIGGACKQGSVACCPSTTVGSQSLVNVGSVCAPIGL